MKKMYQVFVSSTYEDLKEERNEVIRVLLELGCFPASMENFPAADDDQWTYIERMISACDYYIVIIGGRYGSELPNGMSYTEREYRYALEKEIPVLAFVHNNIDGLSVINVDTDEEKKKKLASFLSLVGQKLNKKWRDKAELGGVVSRSLTVIMNDKPRVGYIRGDLITDEHSKLICDHSELERDYQELKAESIISPIYYQNFEHALPALEGVITKILQDEINKDEPLKIRILGVCFHKSFPSIKRFLEKHSASGKRIEVRLSALDRNSEILDVLDEVWSSYFDVYEKQLDELISRLNKIEGANVSLKISKYSYMPNWHGILINKTHLFLSTCIWNSDKSMTAGENYYAYYKKESSWLHNRKILQFKRWFDYGRFHGTVDRTDQLIIDTNKIK